MTTLHHLKRLKVKLRVLSPTHIGCGEKLRKKEMVFDHASGGVLMIPSLPEMLNGMLSSGNPNIMAQYEAFMRNPNETDLERFLTEHNMPLHPVPSWIKRTVKVSDFQNQINEMSAFVHHTDGQAYIPGSSIKGALRTALLASLMRAGKCRNYQHEREGKEYENILRTLGADERNPNNAVNDLLRGLEVSDSAPLRPDDMVVCRREDIGLHTNETAAGRIPTFLECLRPRAETHFYITLDQSILREASFMEKMKTALIDWDEFCYERYDRHFESERIDWAEYVAKEGVPLRLGGATGFQTHSLVYCLYPGHPDQGVRVADALLSWKYGNSTYKHAGQAAAPYRKKATHIGKELYPLGHCELIF